MFVIIKTIIISNFFIVFSILLPGVFFYYWYKNLKNISDGSIIEKVLLIFTFGYLFNSLQFLIVYFIAKYNILSIGCIVFTKIGIDLLLSLYVLIIIRRFLFSLIKEFHTYLVASKYYIILAFSIIIGLVAIFRYPHVLDSFQLQWTRNFIFSQNTLLTESSGAFGYSALIFFIGVLYKNIPLVTLSAGFKIFYLVLLTFSIIYLIERIKFINRKYAIIAFSIILVTSNFGIYGVIQLGKDSILAVIFSFIYIASLMSQEELHKHKYIFSGMCFLCAIISGVITVPYLIIISSIYFILILNEKKPFRFPLYLLIISFPGLLIAIRSMTKFPFVFIAIILISIIVIIYLLSEKNVSIKIVKYIDKYNQYIIILIIVSLILFCISLMPAKVLIIYWADALGNPLTRYSPPLDGKMTFFEFLLYFEEKISIIVSILGVVGMLVFMYQKENRKNKGLQVLAIFPFATVFIVLFLVKIKSTILTGFNYWDIMRDIPLWYGGLLFGLFSIISLDTLTDIGLFSIKFKKILFLLGCVTIIFITIKKSKNELTNIFRPIHNTSIGGHEDRYFAQLVETLFILKNNNKLNLYISNESVANNNFFNFQMYINALTIPLSCNNKSDIDSILKNGPSILIMQKGCLLNLIKEHKNKKILIKELKYFPEVDESIYSIDRNNYFEYISISENIFIRNGFHGIERYNNITFRWMEKTSELIFLSEESGNYEIEFDIINKFINSKNKLKIFYNDKHINTYDIINSYFNNPKTIKIHVFSTNYYNIIKLLSKNEDGFFSEKDKRPVAYGIIWPIKIKRM